MIKKITVVLFLIILIPISGMAQETNYVNGELIIELKSNASLNKFKTSFQSIDLKDVRLLSKRMNIWLFQYNPAKVSSEDVLFQIRQNKEVNIVQFNHFVQSRNNS